MPGVMIERKTLKEFRHELNLSADRHVIVEGHSDRSFYTAWLDAHDCLDGVSVQAVGSIEVENDLLRELGLPDAERSRVIALAGENEGYHKKLLCIADRDTGVGVNRFQYRTLAWTDYPALESYVMHPKLFRVAHQACLQGRIKGAEALYKELSVALQVLWRVRAERPYLEEPNYKKGVKSGGGLMGFDVYAAIGESSEEGCNDIGETAVEDVRKYAYGHDIASLLFAAYTSEMKNKLNFSSESSLERSLRASVLSMPELANEGLFVRLREWVRKA